MMLSSPQDGPFDVVISSDTAEACRVQDHIERLLRSHQFEDREIFGIRLALEEAMVNAIKHGNRMDQSKTVRIRYRVSPNRFEIAITDQGPGFNPEAVPDCCADENLDRPCGRGLFLMRHYMTEVEFHPPGNHLVMTKVRNAAGEPAAARR
jgi:serine/threonine-protein kinase RsbW